MTIFGFFKIHKNKLEIGFPQILIKEKDIFIFWCFYNDSDSKMGKLFFPALKSLKKGVLQESYKLKPHRVRKFPKEEE